MHGEQGRTLLLTSCLVLAALVGLSEGGWERVCSFDDASSSQGVCGKQLAGVLSLVCGHRGYQGVEKRTELLAVKKRDAEGKFFLPKQKALEFLTKRSQGWQTQGKFFRGITCECCQYHCTLPELRQYCAEPVYDEKRTFWPKHRERSTGNGVADRDEQAAAEPNTAQKTYRNIRPIASRSTEQQLRSRHVRST